jgi:hypothetical protein
MDPMNSYGIPREIVGKTIWEKRSTIPNIPGNIAKVSVISLGIV